MGRFDRGNSRGGFNSGRGRDRGFSGEGGFSRDRPQRREMFDVTCTKCGKDARVPFKPTGSKPVLCSDCFSKDGGDRRGSNGSGSGSVDLTEINAKLDKIIRILGELELDVEADVDEDSEDDSDEEEN